MRNKMLPYILITTGSLLLLSGLGLLIRQKASANSGQTTPLPLAAANGKRSAAAADAAPTPTKYPAPSPNHEKGLDFEKWAICHVNPKYWKLEQWQGDKYHNGQYPESNRNPDLVYTVKVGGQEQRVALECKWRKAYRNEGIDWATKEQIDIYNRFQTDNGARVFALIGVGGSPSAPEEVYIVPLRSLKYPFALKEYLERYRAESTSGKFYYDFGKERLVMRSKQGA